MKSARPVKNKRAPKTPLFIKLSLSIIVIFIFVVTIFKISEQLTSSNEYKFSRLEITLAETPIEQIDQGEKDTIYPGNTAVLIDNGKTFQFENVEIKKRGNATQQYAKKPYQIKFDHRTPLFDLGSNRKWVLLANYSDHTSLRTDTAFYLEKMLKNTYPLSGQFVELSIDNNYRGLYYLTDKFEIGKDRINLQNQDGVIVELDNLYGGAEGCNYDLEHNCLVVKDLVNKDQERPALDAFMQSLDKLEQMFDAKDFNSIEKIIDVDSFVRYYLISEFTVNPDAYSTSFFMYKDGPKIYAGAGWDFDAALGNKLWNTSGVESDVLHSPTESNVLRQYLKDTNLSTPYAESISSIMYNLIDIPEFSQRVKEVYQQTLSGHSEELLDHIRNQANYIRDAALRDQKRWKIKANFDEEVDYLIDWVAKRYAFFEQTYGQVFSEPIN